MANAVRSWKLAALVATLVSVGLIASGCTPSDSADDGSGTGTTTTLAAYVTNESAGSPQSGGEIVFGLNAETDSWSPVNGRWAGSAYIVGFSIMDPLAAYDESLTVQPYLAKSFTHNADFTQWTIGLREGVTLHDGKPVDAALVKANLDAQKASFLTSAVFAFIDSFSVTDPLTVVVKMNKPWSSFPAALTRQVGAISSPETFSGPGAAKPVGSGPFIFDEWIPNKSLTVHRNPNYWRKGFPLLDKIEFRPLADVQARGKALDSGDINIFETQDATQILGYVDRATKNDDGVQIFTDRKQEGFKVFVGLNTTKEPFDDPIARQAIAYAGDTVQLAEQAYEGVFQPAYGVYSESSPLFNKDANFPRHDLEKAKQLAGQYQAKHGKPIEFTSNITPDPAVAKVSQVLQQQLAEAGITVHLNAEEQAKLIIDALTGNFQATGFVLFNSTNLDREYVFFASEAQPNGMSSLNFTRLGLNPDGTRNDDNKKIVEAMNKARTTDDPAVQKEQFNIVQAEMAKNLNLQFLVQQTSAVVYEKDLHGVKVYTLPDAAGAPGKTGVETGFTLTFNLWLSK